MFHIAGPDFVACYRSLFSKTWNASALGNQCVYRFLLAGLERVTYIPETSYGKLIFQCM